jgi:ubiquinone biosynthesis protein
LGRFGPRLPNLVESALTAQANSRPEAPKRRKRDLLYGAVIGGGLVGLGVFLSSLH